MVSFSQVARNLTPEEIADKKILDYGCGAGCVSNYLLKFHPGHVTGIDVGQKNIEYANGRINKYGYQNIEFICADLQLYSFGAETYDIIWSDTVIEVMNIPLEALIKIFYDLLNPHGILYVSFTKKNFNQKNSSEFTPGLPSFVFCFQKFRWHEVPGNWRNTP